MNMLIRLWCKYNPFDIDTVFNKLINSFDDFSCKLDSIDKRLDVEIKLITRELNLYKSMINTIGDTIPDMMWFKDMDGKYLYANNSIRKGLLFCQDPIGKTDVELASSAKIRFGDNNHTFGEKCANSDKVVIEKTLSGTFTKDDGRFLESGKIKGRMVYLEVFKAPIHVDGELIGVCGTGRDITVYVEAYRNNGCALKCGNDGDIFKRYEFGEIDNG